MITMTQDELFNVQIPQKTETYSPVTHQQIVEEIEENVDKIGLNIASRNYVSAMNGNLVTGYFDLEAGSDVFQYRLAFQNSYNKERPLCFVGGTSVMICSNGMILGESIYMRRHTGSIVQEMNDHIHSVIEGLEPQMSQSEDYMKRMKQVELDPTATAELCGRLFMEWDVVTSSQLNIIRDELKKPSHDVFADPTLWSLYNHTTEALKKTHAYNYTQKHKALQENIEREFALIS